MVMLLFLLFIILKQFYIFPSGSLGLADICLMGSFLVIIFYELRDHHLHQSIREEWLFCVFIVFVIIINSIYSIYYKSMTYQKSSLFWIYNSCAIWTFQEISQKYGKEFLEKINYAAKANLIIQFGIFLSGQGRVFHEYWGPTRYMGTFNDPNQLAFFVFMMLLLIYLYSEQFRDKTFGLYYIMAVIIIIASKSTGILLGILVFTVGILAYKVYYLYRKGCVSKKMWATGSILVAIAIIGFLIWVWPPENFNVQEVPYNILTRIQDKIWKVSHGGLECILQDRGIEKLFLYPQFLLFGAGEGGYERFTLAVQVNEIHSCLLNICFCYGIIPTIILMIWLIKKLKKNTGQMWCAIIGMLVESFFLINYRQPMFWMILLYGSVRDKIRQRDKI